MPGWRIHSGCTLCPLSMRGWVWECGGGFDVYMWVLYMLCAHTCVHLPTCAYLVCLHVCLCRHVCTCLLLSIEARGWRQMPSSLRQGFLTEPWGGLARWPACRRDPGPQPLKHWGYRQPAASSRIHELWSCSSWGKHSIHWTTKTYSIKHAF